MQQMPDLGGAPISLSDVYHVLFRHKWKIICGFLIGSIIAGVLPTLMAVPYQSEASLLIRYVLEGRTPGQPTESEARFKMPDARGENIINSEQEILTSLDLALKVADVIGPEKLLGKKHHENDREDAARLIQKYLIVDVPKKTDVIHIVFKHKNKEVAQRVLHEIIQAYLTRHAEIHQGGGFDAFLSQETARLKVKLADTEERLRQVKNQADIISLDDSKKAYGEQIAKLRQELLETEAQLAEREAAARALAKLTPVEVRALETNAPVAAADAAEYDRLQSLAESLRKKEEELLHQYTRESTMVAGIESEITGVNQQIGRLVEKSPGLVSRHSAVSKAPDAVAHAELDPAAELAKVAALRSRWQVLTNQLAVVKQEAKRVSELEGSITELQRQKEVEEEHYKSFAANLEQSQIDAAMGPGRVSNINTIQAPSPPTRKMRPLYKLMAGALFGSITVAIMIAFFLEFFVDQSFKRPREIEIALGLPLLLSIPKIDPKKPRFSLLKGANGQAHESNGETKNGAKVNGAGNGAEPNGAATWSPKEGLRPFYETLRDRILDRFDSKGLVHKPKLIGITSCAPTSGVSTTAAGLAATLSETGDGNVLLVDMNPGENSAQYFCRGNLECRLDDALESSKRDNAMVQSHLYVVNESPKNDNEPQTWRKRFSHWMPKLRGSDYDYIIFDLPPVSHISITSKAVRFMDSVIYVVEAEKNNRDVVRRGASLLAESKQDILVVFNKCRNHLPRVLREQI